MTARKQNVLLEYFIRKEFKSKGELKIFYVLLREKCIFFPS